MQLDTQRSHRIFRKLLRVAPDVERILLYAKSSVPGFMDLQLDVLSRTKDYRRVVLSHYWQDATGRLIADPSVSIAVFLNSQRAEPLSCQVADRVEQAFAVPGGLPDPNVQRRLAAFLERWLDNLTEQGHVLSLKNRWTI